MLLKKGIKHNVYKDRGEKLKLDTYHERLFDSEQGGCCNPCTVRMIA